MDFLRVHYFLLTEFDCKREAATVCSFCYLLQETGLTHKITFWIKKKTTSSRVPGMPVQIHFCIHFHDFPNGILGK